MSFEIDLLKVLDDADYANFDEFINLLSDDDKIVIMTRLAERIQYSYNKLNNSFFFRKKSKYKIADEVLYFLKVYQSLAEQIEKHKIGFGK
jgi:hypothetical protein